MSQRDFLFLLIGLLIPSVGVAINLHIAALRGRRVYRDLLAGEDRRRNSGQ